ncbi:MULTISPECIES: DUF2281 domain-containing protein [unclassified Anabaena]|uniref:DUF2281 domain-containing protein n=1 Tax=unclassified Anabaena TaxID=2619674 RepID=UPI0039C6A0BB
MIAEQELLSKWRSLSPDKQEEVLDFIEFLRMKTSVNKTPLGERLRQIRSKIIDSGEPLLSRDEIEKEIASRRGGVQETEA